MIEKIEYIMEHTLMMSVKNIADELHVDIAQVKDAVQLLENEGKIRIAYGKSCNAGCSSCDTTCDPKITEKKITDTTILISMIRKHNESIFE
jgi:DNA-binding transcriptional MocR family regulator